MEQLPQFVENIRALVAELETLRQESGTLRGQLKNFDITPEGRLLRTMKAALNFYDMER